MQTLSRRFLASVFGAVALAASSISVMAQDEYADRDFKDGAVQGAFESARIYPAEDYLSYAKDVYGDKPDGFHQGFAAGAQCAYETSNQVSKKAGILIENLLEPGMLQMNPKIEDFDAAGSYGELLNIDAAAICQKAFITRYQLGL